MQLMYSITSCLCSFPERNLAEQAGVDYIAKHKLQHILSGCLLGGKMLRNGRIMCMLYFYYTNSTISCNTIDNNNHNILSSGCVLEMCAPKYW